MPFPAAKRRHVGQAAAGDCEARTRVALNGYGVVGKRVADAVASQKDMELIGISDIETDWRIRGRQTEFKTELAELQQMLLLAHSDAFRIARLYCSAFMIRMVPTTPITAPGGPRVQPTFSRGCR